MAPEPVKTADIAQTPSQDTKQLQCYTGSAESAPSPLGRPPLALGANYYLTEGLEGVETQHYRGTESFMTAINLQKIQLHSGNAGQYAVFSHITPHQLANLDDFRTTHCKSLRFLYYESEETLIVRIMPGNTHELSCSGFEIALYQKLTQMALLHELLNTAATTYKGVGCGGEADSSFTPLSTRPLSTDWPTLVVEHGVSQSFKRLRGDASWWLTSSTGQVKIVLLFSISEKNRKIQIEQWEMSAGPDGQITGGKQDPDQMRPECVNKIEISETDAGRAFLELSFEKLFLRKPVSKREMNIWFSTEDLERYAAYAWRQLPSRKPICPPPQSPAMCRGPHPSTAISGCPLSSYRGFHFSSAIWARPLSSQHGFHLCSPISLRPQSSHRRFHLSSTISRVPPLSHHNFQSSSHLCRYPLSTLAVPCQRVPAPLVLQVPLSSTTRYSCVLPGSLCLVVGAVLRVRRPGFATSVLSRQTRSSWISSRLALEHSENTVSRLASIRSPSSPKFSKSAIRNSGSQSQLMLIVLTH